MGCLDKRDERRVAMYTIASRSGNAANRFELLIRLFSKCGETDPSVAFSK